MTHGSASTAEICKKNGKPALVKKLQLTGGSFYLFIPIEWIRKYPQFKSDRRVVCRIENGELVVSPYQNEETVKVSHKDIK
jgi:hypothetical protein